MNILLLKAWLSRCGPELIGARMQRARQQDDRSLVLELDTDSGPQFLLLSVLEEYPVIALVQKGQLPEASSNEGNFVKAINFHLEDYRLVSIQQHGFDRSVQMTFRHRDKYGQETLKILRLELAGRSANAFLISERGMVISIMKRVRRERERIREIVTGKPLPDPPPLGKYIAESGVHNLTDELAQMELATAGDPGDLLHLFFTKRVAGGDQRIWPQLEQLIPIEYDIDGLHAFIDKLQAGEFNQQLFQIGSSRDENAAGLEQWLAARKRRGATRKQENPQQARTAATLDQLIANRRTAQRADELEMLALDMLGSAARVDQAGNSTQWLRAWQAANPDWAEEVDALRSVQDNAAALVHLAQRLRRALSRIEENIAKTQEKLQSLERLPAAIAPPASLNAERNSHELALLEKQGAKLRRFISSDGLTILCGINDRSNDILVRIYGSARHLWLHARDHAGSHVVVLDGGRDTPSQTLEEAAVIAAYFSQGRDEMDVDVSYLPMNQIRRPKNARPGQVLKLSEKVISVRPQRFEQLRPTLSPRQQ